MSWTANAVKFIRHLSEEVAGLRRMGGGWSTGAVTSKGQGRVLGQEILARKLLVEFEDGRRIVVPADEILTRL